MSSRYDAFISYAVEDKIEIVNDLVKHLEQAGISVWYTGRQLRVDTNAGATLEEGFKKSSYCIVVFSVDYFRKQWPQKELHTFWLTKNQSSDIILPVWHNLSKDEIETIDPLLTTKQGLNTVEGSALLAREIIKKLKKKGEVEKRSGAWWLIFSTVVVAALWSYTLYTKDFPDDQLIRNAITERILLLNDQILKNHCDEISSSKGDMSNVEQLMRHRNHFNKLKARSRSEYTFFDGFRTLNGKEALSNALGFNIDALKNEATYGLMSPDIYVILPHLTRHSYKAKFIILNSTAVAFSICKRVVNEKVYSIEVDYKNYIRYLTLDLTFSEKSDWIKRSQLKLEGLLPRETYLFRKEADEWVFAGLNYRSKTSLQP